MPDPPGLPKLQEGLVAAREWLDKAQVRRSWRRQAGAAPVLEPSLQRFSLNLCSFSLPALPGCNTPPALPGPSFTHQFSCTHLHAIPPLP